MGERGSVEIIPYVENKAIKENARNNQPALFVKYKDNACRIGLKKIRNISITQHLNFAFSNVIYIKEP